MINSIKMSAIVMLVAAPAFSEGASFGRFSYDYSSYESDDFDQFDVGLLQGEAEYEVSQFLLSAKALSFSVEGENVVATYDVSGAYVYSPEGLAGLGLLSIVPDEGDTVTGFEVFAQYETPQFGAAINLSQQDVDEDNITTFLISEFAVSTGFTLGAAVTTESEFDGTTSRLVAEYDDGPFFARVTNDAFSELDGGLFGLRGSYDVAPQLRASASYQSYYGDDFTDISAIAVGGGYKISDTLWFDASFGVIQSETSENDISLIQASLTYETGARKRLDDRFAQATFDDFVAGFGTAFAF